jgi:formiminoglutamase
MTDDPNWPRASAWLAGDCLPSPERRLGILGAPLHRGSITPGRSDLAPNAIRETLKRFSPYDLEDDHDLRHIEVRDAGDLPVAELTCEDATAPISAGLREALANRDAAILLGGDNSITRPGLYALDGRCALITLDAHFDLRDLSDGLNNGNPIRALLEDGMPGANIVQIGLQAFANSQTYAEVARSAGMHFITAGQVRRQHGGLENAVAEALERLEDLADAIYVNLDIDVLDRAFAPAAPGSRPGGFAPWELRRAARRCGQHPKVRVMDIVELDPERDVADVTVLAAASCLLAFASGVLSRPK